MADLLVIAPHPDDAEIHGGGLIAAQVRQGRSVAIVDATAGELGSRGTPATRAAEAAAAAADLGVAVRENLGLPDGGLSPGDRLQRDAIVGAIRRHRPRTVVAVSGVARHPDHIALAQLVQAAIKAAALHRLAAPGDAQAVDGVRLWLVEAELPAVPTLIVPLTAEDWARKMRAVGRYGSQLAGSSGPPTSISRPEFLEWIEARGRVWGHQAGAAYGEALTGPEAARVEDLCRI
jgi:bacillithiol biosynthesis deacetylase BshB1